MWRMSLLLLVGGASSSSAQITSAECGTAKGCIQNPPGCEATSGTLQDYLFFVKHFGRRM